MEQPCYKCGQTLEEGTPFCPSCGAPQIRVVMAEPMTVPAAAIDTTSSEAEVVVPIMHSEALPGRGVQLLKPCFLAALVASILVTLGLNVFVAMIGVGFLAVIFYRQRMPVGSVRMANGAGVGALAGVLWFAMSTIIGSAIVLVAHKGPEIRQQLLERLDQAAKQTTDPQALAMFDRLKTPGGIELLMVGGVIFAFFASLVLAGVGGAVGAAILGRRDGS